MTLNGKPLTRFWLDHSEIVQGGTLEIWLKKPDLDKLDPWVGKLSKQKSNHSK